ncbi:MAG: hypothetical protein K1X54_02735 [Flavobacteriales bacterium]|nr:hypothetical protein [Flavobacteriales bacterium]
MKKALSVLLLLPSFMLAWAKLPQDHVIGQSDFHSSELGDTQNQDNIIVVESPYMVAGSELIIYFSSGKELQRQKVTDQKMYINTAGWPASTYFFVLSSNKMNTVISTYKVERKP